MNADWYPGIQQFCSHWSHAPTLQQTFATLEREFDQDSDGCIDASKALVEVACQVIVSNLDDPLNPKKPKEASPDFGAWVAAAVMVLKLSEVRDEAFKKLISQHHKLTTTLGDLRNKAGTLSHGKDAFIERLAAHHRRSSLLAADAIITFLHFAYLERELDPVRSFEPYERFRASNALIDRFVSMSAEVDDDGLLQVEVVLPNQGEVAEENRETIPLTVEASRLLFGIDRDAYKSALNACRDAAVTAAEAEETEESDQEESA